MINPMSKSQTNSNVQQQIDENLKRVYDEALKEEIPDRFKQLLAQLKAKEEGK
ncbi:NepR family anti-sigma factor [Gemmobacter fulvus]|uniref:NepR family anti-sigma factor n=1 Tax=Gemmobacter fulvus TaxID=2840474 RepID=UPI00279695B9|nr:NepR family anti-sigma factor [Gemmobacter fulvus]MDQ1849666.1 NepR family anti-sigma factor [Gemmobacter fulvus]